MTEVSATSEAERCSATMVDLTDTQRSPPGERDGPFCNFPEVTSQSQPAMTSNISMVSTTTSTSTITNMAEFTVDEEPIHAPSFDEDFTAFPESPLVYGPAHFPLALSDQDCMSKDIQDEAAEQGVCGLRNLGNTCFLNAGLQCLLGNPFLISYFLDECHLEDDIRITLTGRFLELLNKVWSGRFSSLHLGNFKEVLGEHYPQFRDYRQHDCQEFLALLLDTLHEQLNKSISFSPSSSRQLSPVPCEDKQSASVSCKNKAAAYAESGLCQFSSSVDSSMSCEKNVSRQSSITSCRSEATHDSTGCQRTPSLDSAGGSEKMLHHSVEPDAGSSEMKHAEMLPNNFLSLTSDLGSHHTEDNQISPKNMMNNALCMKPTTSFEEFYMKDTKTLNTNVIAHEFMQETEIAVDSQKFHKADNNARPVTDSYEQITDYLLNEVKGSPSKPSKDTNLLANQKDKFESYSHKCLLSQLNKDGNDGDDDVEDTDCSINNIKRIKIDEDEKNIRMQARMKVNTNKNPTKGLNNDQIAGTSGPSSLAANDDDGGCCSTLDAQHIADAERAWRQHLEKNQSIIVNTFQGQFKSTVICSECQQVSVMYEPFMYLSVPLPHAMDRQICVTFLGCDTRTAIRYLVTLNKHDNVRKLKTIIRQYIGDQSADITIAEVLDSHIARTLEDTTPLRYINDTYRTVYAIEMFPPPAIEDVIADVTESTVSSAGNEVISKTATDASVPNNSHSCTSPSCEQMDSLTTPSPTDTTLLHDMPTNNQNNAKLSGCCDSKEHGELPQIVNNLTEENNEAVFNMQPWHEDFVNTVHWKHNRSPDNLSSPTVDLYRDSSVLTAENAGAVAMASDDHGMSACDKDVSEKKDEEEAEGDGGPVTDQWQSCAICLEEMADPELMAHTSCGGTLCQACLEMSFKHYGDAALICPVCSCSVDPLADFVQLSAMADYKPKTRILSVPIVFRCERRDGEGAQTHALFGHPMMLYLASNMMAESLYEAIARVVPWPAIHNAVLTDGQGLHCSRCLFTSHCTGCVIPRTGSVTLQPSDHLAVCYSEAVTEQFDISAAVIDDKSMENRLANDDLTLYDCIDAFMDSEILDEHNPWYCPRCQRNQCAQKTLTVWNYPDTLVVHLKRFVFHELSSTKIDKKVVFPLEDLDLSDYISGPRPVDGLLHYDLHSAVCHFGGVNAGHYTAYAKHPDSQLWYYYNDETCEQKVPQEADYSNAYILFYQRKGSASKFKMPDALKLGPFESEAGRKNECMPYTSNVLSPQPSTSMQVAIYQPILSLKDPSKTREDTDSMDVECDPELDSTLDFYS